MNPLANAIRNPPKQSSGSSSTRNESIASRAAAVATRSRLVNDSAFAQKVVDGDKEATTRLNQVDRYLHENGGPLGEDELKRSYPEKYTNG